MRAVLIVTACLTLPVAWGLAVGWLFDRLSGEGTRPEPPEYSI